MAISPAATRLSPAGQRVLASFLAGRLPAGQLHTELMRTEGMTDEPPPLAADSALVPVPPAPAPRVLPVHAG